MQRLRAPFLTLVSAALASGSAHAQVLDWIQLSPFGFEGQPAQLILDPSSHDQTTVFELVIHGYWTEDVKGPDGLTYERLTFPGLGVIDQLGAPELPAMRTQLVAPSGATEIVYGGHQVGFGDLIVKKARVAPQGTMELDLDPPEEEGPGEGDDDGTPAQWVQDAALYATDAFFPAEPATQTAPLDQQIGGAKVGEVELFPVRWNPVTLDLEIQQRTTYSFRHFGEAQTLIPMTKDAFAIAETGCINVPTAGAWLGADTTTYKGRYLIVTPEAYLDELQPFVDHRKSMGYLVTVRTLEDILFTTCGGIRLAIGLWYQDGDPSYDHFCLLVGDEHTIPMCPVPGEETRFTDDSYGSPLGFPDLNEEVYVGRWPVDNGADVTRIVQKTMDYELDTNPNHDYGDTLLVAHKEDAPGKYTQAQEAVRTALYAVQPNFETAYGYLPTCGDDEVIDAVEDGLGVVCYRGHGDSSNWTGWGYFSGDDGSFHENEVAALTNQQLPVVWSFSCTNNAIQFGDCIGEYWTLSDEGGVSHYGATTVSGTIQNHLLDKMMFHGVFAQGFTVQGQAIAYAENVMVQNYPEGMNAWYYSLLGCPAMQIRRTAAKPIDLDLPDVLVGNQSGQDTAQVQVFDEQGHPMPGVVVCFFQPAFGPEGAEFQANRYTDDEGLAVLPLPAQLGDLQVVVRGTGGELLKQAVQIQIGAWIDLGDGLAGFDGEHPVLSSDSTLLPDSKVRVDIVQARPETVGVLGVGLKDVELPLFGGTIHVFPAAALFTVVTDAEGTASLGLGTWPSAVQAGTEIVLQAGFVDIDAPEGISFTNAILGVSP